MTVSNFSSIYSNQNLVQFYQNNEKSEIIEKLHVNLFYALERSLYDINDTKTKAAVSS